MSLNNISFVKGRGGLGRPLAGKDYISGLLFYTANGNLPTGFSPTSRVKEIFSVEDAENLGISASYKDETMAAAVYTITGVGSTADKITLNFSEPNGKIVTLGSFVKTAAESTVTLLATALVLAVNSKTYLHGYSAANTAGAITITAKAGLGIYPNTTTPLTAVIAGTIAGSITTAFAGGVASLQSVWHYHIAEFFRMQPKGFLWVGFYPVPSAYTFAEIQTMQNAATGDIRQIGVFVDATLATAHLDAIQAVCNTLDSDKMPLSVVYAGNVNSFTNIATLPDLAGLSDNKVSVVVGQDATGLGAAIYAATGKSVTTLGATLGTVALANVQEDIAWVGKFNISNGVECEGLAFANGQQFTDGSVSSNLLDAIDLKRYIFLRKFPNKAGSFFNDDHTAIGLNSDYAYINNNRVIDKAIRGVYASLIDSLNSPLLLQSDGKLANSTVVSLEGLAKVNTDQMVRDSEVSAVEVIINPNQNVASTSVITVTINIVPIGTARNIVVNIGFKTSL